MSVSRTRATGALLVLSAMAAATVLALGSGSSEAAATQAPRNTAPPAISGEARQGATLTASAGTWSGTTPMTFAFQWMRCPASGGSCPEIRGATRQTYTLVSDDRGRTVRVRVTATNAHGQGGPLLSAPTAVVAPPGNAPANTSAPALSGQVREGEQLTASNGGWRGTTPITFTYVWVRCSPQVSNCITIAGATDRRYRLASADVGKRVLVVVTARNSLGGASASSHASDVVQARGQAPVNTVLPRISGTPQPGQRLNATRGQWRNNPTSFAFQWERCNASLSACIPLPGATRSFYDLAGPDVGQRVRVVVTARNGFGETRAVSQPTGIVATAPPSSGVVPVTSVSLPDRLVVDRVVFAPNPVRSRRQAITMRVRVADTRGRFVSGALVFVRSVPLLTTTPPEAATGQDGWATFTVFPKAAFPLRRGWSVQFFVRVRKPGDNILAGVSSRRLVQVRTAPPG
jgi:hypothetical protein